MRGRDVVMVALGGGLGAVWRGVLMRGVDDLASGFPTSIFLANVIAAGIIGAASSVAGAGRMSSGMKLFLMTGICGGLSTFSTFVWDADQLLADPTQRTTALVYLIISMVAGLLVLWLGVRIGDWVVRRRPHA